MVLRVDAVSSMLRLDYSRKEGEWEPNALGGNGNLEAIEFIKDLNETLYRDFPDIQTIAEEATDWPKISKPTTEGGLGFGMKWMMGWMHDTLDYFKREIKYRKFHQNDFTFSMMYFYDENFMLPLSHDEVVHGKSPMIYKMPGDEWQKFANLRLLYTYMFTHPGAKLLFMGNEFGQTNEWDYTSELQWELLQYDCHNKLQHCVRDLCHLLKTHKALYINQFDEKGFEWNNLNHRDESVVSFLRKGNNRKDDVLVILNLTQIPRLDWKVEVFGKKKWQEKFNSDHTKYWGTGSVINKEIEVKLLEKRTKKYQLSVQLPPLSGIVLV
jgi:1,4-alpha-glucan branching enzyme